MLNIIFIVMLFGAFVFSICVHDSAHALMALVLGDDGPRTDGRLSLNPLRHFAPMGGMVALVLAFRALLPLGWSQPVRFDALKLRVGPNFGIILVALAGPLANLLLAVVCGLTLQVIPQAHFTGVLSACVQEGVQGVQLLACVGGSLPWWALRGEQLLFALFYVNVALAMFNLIPLYPLDGYKLVFALLPSRQAVGFRRAEPYMELILLGVIFLLPLLISLSGNGQLVVLSPVYWIVKGLDAITSAVVNPLFVVIFPAI
jgi:Zn-dependent protease